ncbi:MucR family transcriptional regulator [Nocardia tengchongensis]|uniref:MucR family transcriptional regulator n=2 Tax=Nocardia tengchongensis TaxID=2055889 RepID=UPI0036C0169D
MTRAEAAQRLGYATAASLKTVMTQQSGRWPAPVACRRRDRSLLWDWACLRTRARSGSIRSKRHTGADDDGVVTCLICGRRFRSLGPHLFRAHQISAAEYRAEHQLPATTALMATETREVLSSTHRAAIAENPDLLAPMKAATPPLAELARRSAQARAGTDHLAAVRAARRDGALRTLPAAQQARREALLAQLREAGFDSITHAVEATGHMSSRAAAQQLGVGASTVKRWRKAPRLS